MCFIVPVNVAFTQTKQDFRIADSISKSVKYQGDLQQLTSQLTKNQFSKLDKARAILIWITDNISYDYRAYNKHKQPKSVKCKDREDCSVKLARFEEKYLNRVISKRKGVCEGYSRLFQKMCEYAGIQCSVVQGYTKDQPWEIGKTGPLDHAWNVMHIDGKTYWLDATWAAGYCETDEKTGKLTKFRKSFSEYYWLTPEDKLFRNHFPKDTTVIAGSGMTKKKYKNGAYIPNYKLKTIEILSPETGMLNVCIGDTIRFSISDNSGYGVSKILINTNVRRKPFKKIKDDDEGEILKEEQFRIPFTKNANVYSFIYVANDVKVRYLDILFDDRLTGRFRIKISN